MKKLRIFLLISIVQLCAAMAMAQDENKLYLGDVKSMLSSSVDIPVYLDNISQSIVAVQFDIKVPDGVTLSNSSAKNIVDANRCSDHKVQVRPLSSSVYGANRYRVIMLSAKNKSIKGNKGRIFSVNAAIATSAPMNEGESYPLELFDVVVSDSLGKNVMTDFKGSLLSIGANPDFTLSDICVQDGGTVRPGDKIRLSWKVNNVGGADALGGFSEQVSLLSQTTGESLVLGVLRHSDAKIKSGAYLPVAVQFDVPRLVGLDGEFKVQVKLTPNNDSGESAEYQTNNLSVSDSVYFMEKLLYIKIPSSDVLETNGQKKYGCNLERSGSRKESMTFNMEKLAGDERISLSSQSVTINKNSSSASFYLVVDGNEKIDGDSEYIFKVAAANGYAAVDVGGLLVDDEHPAFTITSSKEDVHEGETFQLTVTVSKAPSEDLKVNLSNDHASRFKMPASLVIPAGENSVTADVTVYDDSDVALEISDVKITATADKYENGICFISLYDNDMPHLSLLLAPTMVSESAGAQAISAIIKRDEAHLDSKITINITTSDDDVYSHMPKITLNKGVKEARFSMGTVDNVLKDGDRKVEVKATVYISSCNCSALGVSAGIVTDTVTLLDNDGAALSIRAKNSNILEGSDNNVFTVARNDEPTNDLAVEISTTGNGVTFPATVTIPSGKASVDFIVAMERNEKQGDSETISFVASADGYSKGTCWVMSTDQTLPDAYISQISVDCDTIYATYTVPVKVTVCNSGYDVLPARTPVVLYSNGRSLNAVMYTDVELKQGEQTDVEGEFVLSDVAGTCNLHAVVNDGNYINEINYGNNTSPRNNIVVTSLLRVESMATDKSLYTNKEKIEITGVTKGHGCRNADLEVYFITGGSRFTVKTKTDDDGKFRAEWQPIETLAGHFAIGACMPDENLSNEMVGVDIYGMRRATTSFLTHEMEKGETLERYIDITNHGTKSLTNISVKVKDVPKNVNCEFGTIAQLLPGATKRLIYKISGVACSENNKEWQIFDAEITSAEGAALPQKIYYVVYAATPQLVANVSSIKTTMIKGATREYPITIRNEGREETGEIYVSLGKQSYLSLATPAKMPSLKQFEEADVVLKMTPAADMDIMSVAKGSIYIGCANGSGQSINYSIETVSQATGNLVVDVWDEFTYNTEEAPHVQGATVTLLHPVTNKVMHQALSDSLGLATFDNIAEGMYAMTVTHPKHSSYKGSVLVNPGVSEKQRVFIEYNAISVTMTYEPTEVLDEYDIVTTVVYETNVPKAVVKVDNPEKLILSELQMPYVFNVYMTNVGLVTALDATLTLPDCSNGYTFTPLLPGPFDILPQQTITVPVHVDVKKEVTEVDSHGRKLPRSPLDYYCAQELISQWFSNCQAMLNGTYSVEDAMAKRMQIREACQGFSDPLSIGFKSGGGSKPSKPSAAKDDDGYKEKKGDDGYFVGGTLTGAGCDPFLSKNGPCIKDALEGASNGSGLVSMAVGGAKGCLMGSYFSSSRKKPAQRSYAAFNDEDDTVMPIPGVTIIGPAPIFIGGITEDTIKKYARRESLAMVNRFLVRFNSELGYFEKEGVFPLPFEDDYNFVFDEENFNASPSWWKSFIYKYFVGLYGAYHDFLYSEEVLDRYDWEGDYAMEALSAVVNVVQSIKQSGKEVVADEIMEYRPQWLSDSEYRRIVKRIAQDEVDFLFLEECERRVVAAEMQAQRMGYATFVKMVMAEADKALELYNSRGNSICSKVKLQIDQRLTMTRQAVRGTLTVVNGSSDVAMKDVKLNIVVTDPDGNVASSRIMEIHTEGKTGFVGDDSYESGWELAADATGEAKIIFIPTKYAAPTEPLQYTFAGSISFIDPFTGLEMTRELEPERLTVNPSPNLELTYFMQRDIFGDDPLTREVEVVHEAQFSLLINNKGYGDATNVKMLTNQPQIVENEKGLLVDFEILSSQLNGGDKSLAMGTSVATDFGDIPALSQAYAQWWLTSSLTGHFVDYDVQATHVSSYDNPDLSLLDTVTIHELIHQISIPDADVVPPLIGFMANDVEDTYDYPDILYLTNGTTAPIYEAARSSVKKIDDNEYLLTVSSGASGWNYGNLPDPTGGSRKLVSVVRMSDGANIPLDNFWQTDRTLIDMLEPLYENLLHFADKMSLEGDSYTLLFEEVPDEVLSVMGFSGLPENNSYTREQIDTVVVTFNKSINVETFTTDDITMMHQGERIDVSAIEIDAVNSKTFKLNVAALTELDGYYNITIQTAGIVDGEGYAGESGSMAAWIQIEDGKANLIMKAEPEGAGLLFPGNSRHDYDADVLISAVAAEGYTFVEWVCDDEVYSDSAECIFTMMGQKTVTAVFAPKNCNLTVNYDESAGTVEGAGTGMFDYGTELSLKAVPSSGYYFVAWYCGDSIICETPEIDIKITDDYFLEAKFATVNVVSVLLDENNEDNVSAFYETYGKQYRIKMNRTLVTGKWNTLCVPFDISEQQINKLWGYSTLLMEFKSVTDEIMYFERVVEIKAGVPYLIKPERAVTFPQFTYDNNIVVAMQPFSSSWGDYLYSGVYSPRAWNLNNISGNEYYWDEGAQSLERSSSLTVPLKGLRAYFVVPKGENVRISINGVLTDMSQIADDVFLDKVRIYNMQGTYLGDDIKGLQRGLYIVNGKKCYVE